MAEYDFLQPSKRKHTFVDNLKSDVPVLSDHYRHSSTHSQAALSRVKSYGKSFDGNSKKKINSFGTIINQHQNNKFNTSFQNGGGEGFRSYPAVNQGRNRMFYKSQIF